MAGILEGILEGDVFLGELAVERHAFDELGLVADAEDFGDNDRDRGPAAGVDVVTRPVGLRNESSTLASPEIFQPSSCTERWCWSHRVTRFGIDVGPPWSQCTMWWTSVNSV